MMKMNDFIKMLDTVNAEYVIINRNDNLVAVWVVGGAGETCFKFDKDGNLVSV